MLTNLRLSLTRLLLASLLVLGTFILAGCGSGGSAKEGTVEGTVTVDGTPANTGSVTFTDSTGKSISGLIQPDGSYRALQVPVGECKVTITTPKAPTGGAPTTGMPGMEGTTVSKPVAIPAKYGSAQTSGLTFTVKAGTNKFPIALSAK